ncbi:MAG: class I tRNA ligase family protein, partial [Elusimicrobia bacterium]|nr:class I tRNA ligase family protein [Candidatus Obscuribacterium magneticum]
KYKIADDLKKKGLGEPTITYKLRDWLLSRQRYWGTPIPMLHCPQCGILPVHLKDLPVRLPENVKFTGAGDSPLALMKEWVETSCPKCQGKARRETDTMDTFVDSSWYYARYIDPKNDERPFDSSLAALWLPVTQYIGGIEHACMHLIYSRFFHKVMRDMGLVKSDEPFASLLTQGMVTLGGSAMSKSRGNVVDPEEVIEKYGADTCRLFILFAAPPTQQLEWSDTQVGGVWRFLNRVWRLAQSFVSDEDAKGLKRNVDAGAAEEGGTKAIAADELTRLTHLTIKRVTDDIEKDFGFNTALSAIMELVNALYLYPALGDTLSRESTRVVLELLSPFAPHMAEELWQALGHKTLLAERPWPAADEKKMAAQQIEIVIQVNGKLRDRLRVGASTSEREIKTLALQSLEKRGMKITGERVIYIPQKLLNFVEKGN